MPRHICTLRLDHIAEGSIRPLPKKAGICKNLGRILQLSILVSKVNPLSTVFFRSSTAIAVERRKHLDSPYHYIIHPCSVFRLVWECWMLVVFSSSLIFLPLDLLFNLENHQFNGFSFFVIVLDFACILDICLYFVTGCVNRVTREIILEPRKIARNYVFSSYFVLDVASSIPCELINYILYVTGHSFGIVKFVKGFALVKIVRLRTCLLYIGRLSDLLKINQYSTRIVRYTFISFVLIHWTGCFLYIAVVYAIYLGKHRTYNEWIYVYNTFDTQFNIYLNCIFESMSMMNGIERKYLRLETMDLVLKIIIIISGFVLKRILLVLILEMVLSKNAPEIKYLQIMNEIEKYMRHKKLPLNLQKRIIQYYDYRFQKTYFNENAILNTLSVVINREISLHMHRKLISSVFIFSNLPHHTVSQILATMVQEVFLPNDMLIKAGSTGDCMYFLYCGTVAVLTPSGKEVCHLEEGSYFGEIALTSKDQKRVADVIAIEVCQVYRLDRSAFNIFIKANSHVYDRVEAVAESRLEQTKLIEELHKKFIMERLTARRATP